MSILRARLWSNVWPVMISRVKSPPNPDFAPGEGGPSRNNDRCIMQLSMVTATPPPRTYRGLVEDLTDYSSVHLTVHGDLTSTAENEF